jgi:predicted DCC family thiol-disulfide oxidoreductase YuxK
MYLIDRQGRRHAGAAAFRHLSRRLVPLWPLVPLLHLPGSLPLWRFLYRQVAKRRYRLGKTAPCESETCHLHGRSPEA